MCIKSIRFVQLNHKIYIFKHTLEFTEILILMIGCLLKLI